MSRQCYSVDRRNGEYTKKTTKTHQQISAQNLTPEVVRQGTQRYTLEMDQITTHVKLNKEGKMELDRIYA